MPVKQRKTDEFVVLNGTDADLWGDIDGPVDEAWAKAVNEMMRAKESLIDVLEFNPYHKGPGPGGGQFTGAPSGGASSPALPKIQFNERTGEIINAYVGSPEAQKEWKRITSDKWDPEKARLDKEREEIKKQIEKVSGEANKVFDDYDKGYDRAKKSGVSKEELGRIEDEFTERMNTKTQELTELHRRQNTLYDNYVPPNSPPLAKIKGAGVNLGSTVIDNGDTTIRNQVAAAGDWLGSHVSSVDSLYVVVKARTTTQYDGRAECAGNEMRFPGSAKVNTIIHETAHAWEHSDPRIRDIMQIFAEKRTGLAPSVPLGQGYGPDEITRPDKFYHPYVGKVYNGSVGREVISMGLEAMYERPRAFAKSDPEHFMLMFDLMTKGPAKVANIMGVAL